MLVSKRSVGFIAIGVITGSLFLISGMDLIENHESACFVSFVGGLLSFLLPVVLINNFNPRGSSGNTKGEPRG